MNRRSLLHSALYLAALFSFSPLGGMPAIAQSVDVNAILNDPDAPTAGNPAGDVTIVAFTDYNCPYCKKSSPELERLVKTDGKIRLVYKDWPILSPASAYASQMALAARYQGGYDRVHLALMSIPGRKIASEQMLDAIKASGVDMARLDADLKEHADDIAALLKRNLEQADSMGLQGTPVYLIGPFKIAAALDYDGFKKAVSETRLRAQGR